MGFTFQPITYFNSGTKSFQAVIDITTLRASPLCNLYDTPTFKTKVLLSSLPLSLDQKTHGKKLPLKCFVICVFKTVVKA